MEIVSSDKDQHYLIIVYHSSVEEELMNILKSYGFNKVILTRLMVLLIRTLFKLTTI